MTGCAPERYPHEVRKTLLVTLVLNWLVALFKLFFGYAIRSAGMVADGYHSLADGSSNIIGLFGVRIAARPKDTDHPYGHKKYETFAAVFIAFLLFLVCFHLLHDSVERFHSQVVPDITWVGFAVMGGTLVVNVAVMIYEYRKGRMLGSDILVSDSMHTRADIFTSLSVVAAFVGIRMGHPFLDTAVAVVIVVFIGISAVRILRSTSDVLCDTAALKSADIERVVMTIPGVRRCHRIRTRGRADDIHIDLHVLATDRTPLVEAHNMSVRIEEELQRRFPGVSDVVVHMEPLSSGNHHAD
ncbi:MAG: cation diffusion facilitator family transporter [Deltaproteobacteria bacterium]